jgi:hypothetical protein
MQKSRARLSSGRAISSVVERFLHTEEATGSIPVSPTMFPLQVHFLVSDLEPPKSQNFGQNSGGQLHFGWSMPWLETTCEREKEPEPSEVLL